MVKVIPRQFDAGRLMAPKSIPKEIAQIREEELPPPSSGVRCSGRRGRWCGRWVLSAACSAEFSVAFPRRLLRLRLLRPRSRDVPQRIRVGGNVQAANLINQVRPIYPPLAKQARISGTVELSAIIGKDGRVQDLKVVRGHPLLVQAALDAVKNWVYKPTLLNGEPVEVSTTIDVNFTLAQ